MEWEGGVIIHWDRRFVTGELAFCIYVCTLSIYIHMYICTHMVVTRARREPVQLHNSLVHETTYIHTYVAESTTTDCRTFWPGRQTSPIHIKMCTLPQGSESIRKFVTMYVH